MLRVKSPYEMVSGDMKMTDKERAVFKAAACHKRFMDYTALYATETGKRVLDDLIWQSSIGRTAFCLKSETQTHFNLGKQTIGYHIVGSLTESLVPQLQIIEEVYNDERE